MCRRDQFEPYLPVTSPCIRFAPQGELYKKLTAVTRFKEPQAAQYIKEMTEALIDCHKKHVIHRDIKPENLLIGHEVEMRQSCLLPAACGLICRFFLVISLSNFFN